MPKCIRTGGGTPWRGVPHAMAQLTLWLSRLCVYLLCYASAVYAVVVMCLSVCLSVRLPVTSRYWTNRAGHECFIPQLPHYVIRKIGYFQRLRYPVHALSCGTLSQTAGLENFAMASRSRCQQNSSLRRRRSSLLTPIRQSTSGGCYYKSANCNL